MPQTKNLGLRLQRQADHLDMISGVMIPDYLANTDDPQIKEPLQQARGHLGAAAMQLHVAASRASRS